MKKFFVIALALGLTACAASPEDQTASMAVAQDQLPEGCELTYLGSVDVAGHHRPSRIFVVKCGNVTTTSETHVVKTGKTTRDQTAVTVSY
jgi:uncharacterized lipoprotein YmbA